MYYTAVYPGPGYHVLNLVESEEQSAVYLRMRSTHYYNPILIGNGCRYRGTYGSVTPSLCVHTARVLKLVLK
jgi:hypothetical protein